MFWALLTFLASFLDKSLSSMLVYSVFPRGVSFLPHCPYAALPLLEPFLSLPFNMESGRGFKDQFPQPCLECQRGGICHSSVFWLLQPQNKCILTSIFHTCHPALASLPEGGCEHLDCSFFFVSHLQCWTTALPSYSLVPAKVYTLIFCFSILWPLQWLFLYINVDLSFCLMVAPVMPQSWLENKILFLFGFQFPRNIYSEYL